MHQPEDKKLIVALQVVHAQIGEMQMVRERIMQLESTHNQMRQK